MTLKELEIGKSAVIRNRRWFRRTQTAFPGYGYDPRRGDGGKAGSDGDPMELQVHGYELTLRLAEADQIEIVPISKRTREHKGLIG